MRTCAVLVAMLVVLSGCSGKATVERPIYDWSMTVELDTPGSLVPSVLVYRTHGGRLFARWSVDFEPGTQAMVKLGEWAPKPDEGIVHGPTRGQVGRREVIVADGVLSQSTGFLDGGQPHAPGEYYLELYVQSSPGPWEQPDGTAQALATHGEADEYGGYSISVLARFKLPEFPAAE